MLKVANMNNKFDDVEVLIEGLDDNDINSLIKKYSETSKVEKSIKELKEVIKTKIKIYLKQRQWTRYSDKETDISVTLKMQKKETIDKKQLAIMLTESQLAQVTRTTKFEKINIVTPEGRERLKKYVK